MDARKQSAQAIEATGKGAVSGIAVFTLKEGLPMRCLDRTWIWIPMLAAAVFGARADAALVIGGGGSGPVIVDATVQGTPGGFSSSTPSFFSPAPGNDNTSLSQNILSLETLEFLTNNFVELVLTIQSSRESTAKPTEYALGLGTSSGAATSIINSTGTPWSGFQIQVGILDGAGNLQSVPGLDFDAPDLDPVPTSDKFTLFQFLGHTINFLGGTIPGSSSGDGDTANHFFVTAGLDIPNFSSDSQTVIIRMRPLLQTLIGTSQDNPVLPDGIDPETGGFVFTGVTGGRWFDPPAYGFLFVMDTPGAGFSSVTLPSGFDPVTVTFDSTSVSGAPGATITLGTGVTTFTITGINPPADSDNPASYPVLLNFTTNDPVNFKMIPLDINGQPLVVPEPSSLTVWGCGLAIGLGLAWRRRRFV
jgi:hypothetical protein